MEISRPALSPSRADPACAATLHSAGTKPHLRRHDSEWRATAHREYVERELAGKIAAVSALQGDHSAERDHLSCVRPQPEIRLTTEAESATELLSAPRGGDNQASSRGRGMGVFDSCLDTRRRGKGDHTPDRECRRAESGGAADVQAGGGCIYAVERRSGERPLGREELHLHWSSARRRRAIAELALGVAAPTPRVAVGRHAAHVVLPHRELGEVLTARHGLGHSM